MKRLFALFLLTFTLGAIAMEKSLIISINNDELISAVQNNEVQKVSDLIGGMNIGGIKNKYGLTLLHLALTSEMAKLLLDRGADINDQNNKSQISPLHNAAAFGRFSVVQTLIKRGAVVNCTTAFGSTPLHLAISHLSFNPDLAQFLIDNGASMTMQDKRGDTTVHLLIKWSDELDKSVMRALCLNILREVYQKDALDKLFGITNNKGRTFFDLLPDSEFKTVLVHAAKNPNAWMNLSLQESFKQEKKRVVRSGRTAEFLRNREHNIKK